MFERHLAGLAVLCSVTAAAEAATVREIDTQLRFNGRTYFDTLIFDTDDLTYSDIGTLEEEDDVWGLPKLFHSALPAYPNTAFPDYVIGETLNFTARLNAPDSPSEGAGSLDYCWLGSYDCSKITRNIGMGIVETVEVSGVYISGDSFDIFYGGTDWLRGSLTPAGNLRWDFYPFGLAGYNPADPQFVGTATNSQDFAFWSISRANFSVVVPVPTVPLPASVLFLPMGIAGLAAFGRRRSKARA